MAALFRKGIRALVRTTGGCDDPPSGQRALLATSAGWVDRQSDGTETRVATINNGTVMWDSIPLRLVYVTPDWATDPNNPTNGGSLPANIPILET